MKLRTLIISLAVLFTVAIMVSVYKGEEQVPYLQQTFTERPDCECNHADKMMRARATYRCQDGVCTWTCENTCWACAK